MAEVGVVAIGRNEGDRLVRCLRSVSGLGTKVVYVDSGSSDQSVEIAAALGAIVVQLDSSVPFGPARARNEGAQLLLEVDPSVQFIQFIDGDCELREGWLATAAKQLSENPRAAVVAGRLRECSPDTSIYNRFCDIEWEGRATVTSFERCGGSGHGASFSPYWLSPRLGPREAQACCFSSSIRCSSCGSTASCGIAMWVAFPGPPMQLFVSFPNSRRWRAPGSSR